MLPGATGDIEYAVRGRVFIAEVCGYVSCFGCVVLEREIDGVVQLGRFVEHGGMSQGSETGEGVVAASLSCSSVASLFSVPSTISASSYTENWFTSSQLLAMPSVSCVSR